MGKLTTAIVTLVVLNIFLYIGVNFAMNAEGTTSINEDYNFYFKGDLIDQFMDGQSTLDGITQDTKDNWTSYGVDLNSSLTSVSKDGGIPFGDGGIQFLDALNIVWGFVLMLGNIIVAPFTLFFNFRMPVFVGLMIGFPYFTVLLIAFMVFIRGGGE